MKHVSASLLILAVSMTGLSGCRMLFDTTPEKPVIQAPPLNVTEPAKPVVPDEITPSNASSKARQLLKELETDGVK